MKIVLNVLMLFLLPAAWPGAGIGEGLSGWQQADQAGVESPCPSGAGIRPARIAGDCVWTSELVDIRCRQDLCFVEAAFEFHNPTDRPDRLEAGFPQIGGRAFELLVLRLDGRLIRFHSLPRKEKTLWGLQEVLWYYWDIPVDPGQTIRVDARYIFKPLTVKAAPRGIYGQALNRIAREFEKTGKTVPRELIELTNAARSGGYLISPLAPHDFVPKTSRITVTLPDREHIRSLYPAKGAEFTRDGITWSFSGRRPPDMIRIEYTSRFTKDDELASLGQLLSRHPGIKGLSALAGLLETGCQGIPALPDQDL